MIKRPLVGIGVIVINKNKVLLGKRKSLHGKNTWCFPGGYLEINEDIFDCARREVFEETGIRIKHLRTGPYVNNIFKIENKHSITLFVIADYASGIITIKEPEKCEKWAWFSWSNLPKPLFLPVQNLLKINYNPFL